MFLKINWRVLLRKKRFTNENISETKLSRVLNLIDVCAIGISWTLGGIYVLIGSVIKNYGGPSVVISFLIAGFATLFSALAYAELGARVPRSGSAYVYIYVTIGEFVAFIMGWDLILEYIIGIASDASALSQYIDYLCNRSLRKYLLLNVPININGLGFYPDFLAFLLVLIGTGLMIIGVRESGFINKIFAIFNVGLLLFIIVTGATRGNISNWNLKPNRNTSWIDFAGKNQSCADVGKCGIGGFMPFGFKGVMEGAAKCFYTYIGFDAIAATGEEVVDPKRNIPISIFVTLIVCGSLYICLSSVLTLMMPYYLAESETLMSQAFENVGITWATYVISAGAICALASCIYSGLYPMSRITYSMANDGLLFKFLSSILPVFKTPFIASIVTGLLTALLACILNLDELVEMVSIGTLMAYTLVCVCVVLLRYRNECDNAEIDEDSLWKKLFRPKSQQPTLFSSRLVYCLTSLSILCIIVASFLLSKVNMQSWYNILILILVLICLLQSVIIIWCQPQVTNIDTFKMPLIPILPLLSVFLNVYLMTTLSAITWYRFLVWFSIGLLIYFGYGMQMSRENKEKRPNNRN